MKTQHSAEHVNIVDFEETQVAALEYKGDPRRLGDALRTFIAWRRENDLAPRVSATFNIVYDHPADADPATCHYELCAATARAVADNPHGIVTKTIPAGRCAVLRHIGSDDRLGDAVNYLYSKWLPPSGEEPRDFPMFFQRVRFFPEVPEHEAVTDVFLPIK